MRTVKTALDKNAVGEGSLYFCYRIFGSAFHDTLSSNSAAA